MEFKGKIPNIINRLESIKSLNTSISELEVLVQKTNFNRLDSEGIFGSDEIGKVKAKFVKDISDFKLIVEELNGTKDEGEFASYMISLEKEIKKLKDRIEKIGK